MSASANAGDIPVQIEEIDFSINFDDYNESIEFSPQ